EESKLSMAASISAGSAKRPMPLRRQLCHPDWGSTKLNPSERSVVTFLCTERFSHIALFIAGAKRIGPLKERSSVLNRSSARAQAALASRSAGAGARQQRAGL